MLASGSGAPLQNICPAQAVFWNPHDSYFQTHVTNLVLSGTGVAITVGMSGPTRPYTKHWFSQSHSVRCTGNAPWRHREIPRVRQRRAEPMGVEPCAPRRDYRPKPLIAAAFLSFSTSTIFSASLRSSFGSHQVALSHHVGRLLIWVELDLLHHPTTQQRHAAGSGAGCSTAKPQVTCHRPPQGRCGRP